VGDNSSFLKYDVTPPGNRFPTFWRIVLPLQRWTSEKNGFLPESRPAQMKALYSFEQLGTAYPLTLRLTQEERIFKANRCSDLLEISCIWGGGGKRRYISCSGKPPTGPSPEPDKSSTHRPVLNPLNVVHTSTLGTSELLFLRGSIHNFVTYTRIHGGAVGSGTARVGSIPDGVTGIFIDIILQVALWPWVWLSF